MTMNLSGALGADAAFAGLTITGTAFGDKLTGGAGDDILRGLGGADTLNAGAGNDRMFWTQGEGSDLVEGGAGADSQFMTGSQFNFSASGDHALATDGGETLNLHGVEQISLKGLPGAMSVTIGDLGSTDVREVVVQLDALNGVADFVGVNGAASGETIDIQVFSASGVRILDTANGVIETTGVSGLDSQDVLAVNGGLGNDTIRVVTPKGPAVIAQVIAHGNEGADTLIGSFGVERLFGDAGNDSINGGGGDDTIDAGTGSDIIDGGAGRDTQTIVGISAPNVISVTHGVGDHLNEFVNGSTVDVVNVETLVITGAAGQADFIGIGGVSDSTVRFVDADFGVGGVRDFFDLNGTAGGDSFFVGNLNGSTDVGISSINGSAPSAAIHHVDGTDQIEIDALTGNDLIDLTNFNGGSAQMIVDGNSGSDHMIAGFGTITFVYNAGIEAPDRDVIDNFKDPNPFVHHTIRMENSLDHSLAEMIANHDIVQSGADVVLFGHAGANLTLTNTNLASLSEGDFIFQ